MATAASSSSKRSNTNTSSTKNDPASGRPLPTTTTTTSSTTKASNATTTMVVPTRGIMVIDGYCPHFAAGLQVICFVLQPLRKALIHFFFTTKDKSLSKVEWQILHAIGKLFHTMTKPKVKSVDEQEDPIDPTECYQVLFSNNNNNNHNHHSHHHQHQHPLMQKTNPPNATIALQQLLVLIQTCAKAVPVTNNLLLSLLDLVAMGVLCKQTLVGRKQLLHSLDHDNNDDNDEQFNPNPKQATSSTTTTSTTTSTTNTTSTTTSPGMILQRTKKETRILWCPHELEGTYTSLSQALQQFTKSTLMTEINWNTEKFDFEVQIPLLNTSSISPPTPTTISSWTTTKTIQFTTLPAYLFFGLQRIDPQTGNTKNTRVDIPLTLDLSDYCLPKSRATQASTFTLVGGILFDEEDYVAILKKPILPQSSTTPTTTTSTSNSTNRSKENDRTTSSTAAAAATTTTKKEKQETSGDNEDDNNKEEEEQEEDNDDDEEEEDDPVEDWNLLEAEEVIPMTQDDVLEFLQGEDGGVCGTVLIYKTDQSKPHQQLDQLLSDIIISHVSGKLSAHAEFYYEEEIVEDESY